MNLKPEIIEAKCAMVERCLIACIEAIEDRAPTHGEMFDYLVSTKRQNLEIYVWKTVEIVRVAYSMEPEEAGSFVIFSLVNPFEPIPD